MDSNIGFELMQMVVEASQTPAMSPVEQAAAKILLRIAVPFGAIYS
jgi:hypothetical protein